MNEGDLSGKVALVTGSVTGIGRAIAEALGARGAAVVSHGLDGAEATAVAAGWSAQGWRTIASDADLVTAPGSGRLVADVEDALGPIDILVLNASLELPQPFVDLTAEAIDTQHAVNVRSSVSLLQACVPGMRRRMWGRVVAIGSVQEERPNARHLFYAATKAALTSMILNLARHDAATDVTFNVVRPGAIRTERNREALADAAYEHSVLDRIPAGRIGVPSDCTGLVSLLCSEAGSYINGAVLSVDGGLRL